MYGKKKFLLQIPFLFLVMVILLMSSSSSGDWVDYPSSIICCNSIAVERCDPSSSDANSACRDVCHYGGCRKGGQCEETVTDVKVNNKERFCHCNC